LENGLRPPEEEQAKKSGMTQERCQMKEPSVQGKARRPLVATLLLTAVAVALPAIALAQDDQGDPSQGGVAFAGGHMVRGTVTATTADHLTVKTEAGEVYQVALSANTRLTKDRQPVKVADIKIGDAVGAMGVLDAPTKTVHAVFVGVVDAEQVKKARENMGKTYITGKVTAIDMDALKLTVMRPDGVSQVIGVDEQTSFKRGGRGMAAIASGAGVVEIGGGGGGRRGMGTGTGDGAGTAAGPGAPTGSGTSAGTGSGAGSGSGGESITFADIKVGDSIAGRGGLKNGMFVPTELGVMDPAAMGQRRRRGSDGSAPGAAPQGMAAPSGTAAPKNSSTPAAPAGVPQ
jgi:hypothetical protein